MPDSRHAAGKSARLEAVGDHGFELHGHLDFDTATQVLKQSERLFEQGARVRINCAALSYANSAALALMVEWQGWVGARLSGVDFEQVPENLQKLANLCELDQVLKLR